jgi:hypothetical protein
MILHSIQQWVAGFMVSARGVLLGSCACYTLDCYTGLSSPCSWSDGMHASCTSLC